MSCHASRAPGPNDPQVDSMKSENLAPTARALSAYFICFRLLRASMSARAAAREQSTMEGGQTWQTPTSIAQ